MPIIYLIGSLRNPEIPAIANKLRGAGFMVFDDWHAAGPTADDEWKRYEAERGHDYETALEGLAARHVFEFDRHHLDLCDLAVLVMPAGRSGHLELGYVIGKGKPGYVLMDKPDRWDVMYQFATGICFSEDDLLSVLADDWPKDPTPNTSIHCENCGLKKSVYSSSCNNFPCAVRRGHAV